MTAEEFKAAREKLGLSRELFADKLGIEKETVTSKELGRRSITKRDVRMIEKLLIAQQLA